MRILIVNKFLYPNGGSETYIFGLGKQLEVMGHEVQYFGMEHPDRCVGNAVGAYTSYMDFHATSGFKKLLLPFKIVYSFEARRQIRKVLDDFKPDVVHLNNINFQITPSIIYEIRAWDRKCRIICTAHDYQWICPNHMLYIPGSEFDIMKKGHICYACKGGRFIECTKNKCIHGSGMRSLIGSIEGYYYKIRKTYSLVDIIVCPSRFLYEKLSDDPILKDRLVVIQNFINDVHSTSDENEHGTESRVPSRYMLYFGRLAMEKGVLTLIEAVKNMPDVNLVLAGSGPLSDEVISNIEGHDNICYVGFKKGDELKRLVSGADLSVYPSEWYENCPFSVMESICLGTPVLGADIGGIPELINNGTGILFRSGDVDDLRKKIRSLWDDHTVIEDMTARCGYKNFDSVEQYSNKYIEQLNLIR